MPEKYTLVSKDPEFKPLPLLEIHNPGPNIPEYVDKTNPENLFRLYFDNRILDILVDCTNSNATTQRDVSIKQRDWEPVIRYDILSYLGILIWMGIHREPQQRMY